MKKKGLNKRELKKLYTSLIPTIREVARKCGYAIGVHGSLTRDLDLVAVPWVEKCLTPNTLTKRIARAVGGDLQHPWIVRKPHGRIAYSIILNHKSNTQWAVYIDLSITPAI